jgi:hypothetical protein
LNFNDWREKQIPDTIRNNGINMSTVGILLRALKVGIILTLKALK